MILATCQDATWWIC